jgi:hypothetical protein
MRAASNEQSANKKGRFKAALSISLIQQLRQKDDL